MSNLNTRIKALELKLNSSNPDLPSVIIISTQSGRLNVPQDESEIVQYSSNGINYFKTSNESEIEFTERSTTAAKSLLYHKWAVPTLFATTRQMLNCD